MTTDVADDTLVPPASEKLTGRCPDPIELALRTLRSGPGTVLLLPPRHRAAVLEAQQRPHGFPVLVLEETWRLARQPGTDGVEVLRDHFEVLADRCRRTLPPLERQDLQARFLALLAMAHTLRFWRHQPLHSPSRSCELILAEDALQQARLTLVDGTGRGPVRAAVLEAEAMVAGVRRQYGRACSLLAEAAELLIAGSRASR